MTEPSGPSFTARHVLEYDYRRSLGSVLSRFFTGLRDRKIEARNLRRRARQVEVEPPGQLRRPGPAGRRGGERVS